MKEAEIWQALAGLKEWDSASIRCQDGFILSCVNRAYSSEELIESFYWYQLGWKDGLDAIVNTGTGV